MNGKWKLRLLAIPAMLSLTGAIAAAPPPTSQPLECMQRFKLKEFMIGSWWSVSGDEEAVQLYRDCGFNVDLQSCRYELRKDDQLRVAEKYGLKVMIDTIVAWPPGEKAHWAMLDELKWLDKQYGDHPAVIGFLINDNCNIDLRTQAVAKYLLENAPELMAWVSMNPNPIAQAKIAEALPIITSQNYPFLYDFGGPEPQKRIAFCNSLERDRDHVNRHNMCMWSFVNTAFPSSLEIGQKEETQRVSASQTRFQVHASVAYGAQGIPYFMYWHALANDAGPTDLYWAAQESNRYVGAVAGPRVLGHRSIGVFHSGSEQPAGAWTPGPGEFVESMTEGVLAGVLVPEKEFVTRQNKPDCLMVVDKRTVKSNEKEPGPRRIQIRFRPGVERVEEMLPNSLVRTHDLAKSREISLAPLKAGGGVLLYLEVKEHGFATEEPVGSVWTLPHVWKFAKDPDDAGVSRKWFEPSFSDANWADVRDNVGFGWEGQGFPGYTGFGWYRQKIQVPADLNRKHLYLVFEAVDEETWVYIDGEAVFEHTCKTTKLPPAQIWSKPFAFDARSWLEPGKESVLAVRVFNVSAQGGIYVPVHLVATDKELNDEQLLDLIQLETQ